MSELQLSSKLQLLIDEANKFTKTWADKVLAVYDQAKIEGYTPQEARKLVEEKIFSVSSRHMRRILPAESKNQNMIRISKPKQIADTRPQIPAREEKIIEVQTSENDNPYEESQNKIDALIAETQEQQLKPIPDTMDIDIEELQIKLSDEATARQNAEAELKRYRELLEKERDRIKELESSTTSPSNFTTASDLAKSNDDDDTSPVLRSTYKKTIGELNTRILELKDKLIPRNFKEIIEVRGQKLVLNITCANLVRIDADEQESRRLNQ